MSPNLVPPTAADKASNRIATMTNILRRTLGLLALSLWCSPDTASCADLRVQGAANSDVSSHERSEDYTFSCWVNGWRKNDNDRSADIFAIETSRYGFTLDVADLRKVTLATHDRSPSYEKALNHKADRLEDLPSGELLIEIEVDGTTYRATTCAAGQDRGVRHLASARLWESGRFVQHYDFLGLDFRDVEGKQLECDARLDLVAWPGSLTLNLIASGAIAASESTLRLRLSSSAGEWSQETQLKGPWDADNENRVSLTCNIAAGNVVPDLDVNVTAKDGGRVPVRFSAEKNCYEATAERLGRNWKTGYTDIRQYDDFEISIAGSPSGEPVPFLLHLHPPANVTGVCPVLCDEDGNPTGIPLQLSKNWHYPPMGSYVMAYGMLPTDKPATYLMRFAYGFYGTLPSASHAQLSLIGYAKHAGNGRWDQLAIGCWGESICFDMDMSLVDIAITDIRTLMTRRGLSGTKWYWTEAGWGGDWLNFQVADQSKYFQNRLKTAYLSHGPCLTEVQYEGYYGMNQEIDFSAQVQTLRTDDYCRTFQKLRYTFNRDVSATKVCLFKLGRTTGYQTPRISYGNEDGLIREHEVPETLNKGDAFIDRIELSGAAPHWFAFNGASQATARDPKPNGYRALIIRDFNVKVGDQTYKNPIIRCPVHSAGPSNLDLELVTPEEIRKFAEGDCIELDLELVTLPREADDYYGPNDFFREHLEANPGSWKTTYREAIGNHLGVTVSGGTMLQEYPLVIQADSNETTVAIHGGIGAVPIRFCGLSSNIGNTLYQVVNGERIPFNQAVHGNDFWQTELDSASRTYCVTFNLPLDELDESVWVLTQ